MILIFFYDAEQANDSGLASYVAGQIDRSLSWKVYYNDLQTHGLIYLQLYYHV